MGIMDDIVGKNIGNPPKPVCYKDLKLLSESSPFKLVCPECEVGIVGICRDRKTFRIENSSNCMLCGQHFVFMDLNEMKKRFRWI